MGFDRKLFMQEIIKYSAYARAETIRCEERLRDGLERIDQLAQALFERAEDRSRLVAMADRAGQDGTVPRRLADMLRHDPGRFGGLRGGLFAPERRGEALAAGRALGDELEIRADERIILARYEGFYQNILDAEHVSEERRNGVLGDLAREQAYCDATRDSRLTLAERMRDGPGGPQDPQSVGAMRTRDVDSGREWWRQPKAPDERSSRELPAAPAREWWRKPGTGRETVETDRDEPERGRDRERDR